MRVVLLNAHLTTSGRLDAWLEEAVWDVAVLLEVSGEVAQRLAADGRWQASSSAARAAGRHAYPVVILGRGVGPFGDVDVPETFGIRNGSYDKRIHAVSFDWDGTACTVIGLHAPNAVRRGQGDKEEVYRQFVEWVQPLAVAGPVVAALDTNNGSRGLSPDPARADMVHQNGFLRHPETANLGEAYLDVYDGCEPKPATWGRQFYDRVFVSDHLRATSFVIDTDTFCRHDAEAHRLPDHAVVTVEVERYTARHQPAVARDITSSMLGHLGVSGFVGQQEVLATHALAYLLGHQRLAKAFLTFIGRPELVSPTLDWAPEAPICAQGRLDVGGLEGARFAIGIEGKIGAALDPKQLRDYLVHMPETAPLVVVVPASKVEAAHDCVGALRSRYDHVAAGDDRVLVHTWGEVLGAMKGVADLALQVEIHQLEGLCDMAGALEMAAFGKDYQASDTSRLDDLRTLTDRATRRFEPDRVNPMQYRQPPAQYRWFNCHVLPGDGQGETLVNGGVTLGVHPDRVDGPGLLWLRSRTGDPGFDRIRNRWGNLDGLVHSSTEGELWVGFEPPPGRSGEDLVDAVARRITEILALVGLRPVRVVGP